MREIKFRVYDIKCNTMLNVDSLFISEQMFRAENKNEYDVFNFNSDCYSDVMQYIGLKDSKGVEIYEGDIALLPASNGVYYMEAKFDRVAKVIFDENNSSFRFILLREKCESNRKKAKINSMGSAVYSFVDLDCYGVEQIEIIGNIYENPELLKG